MLPKINTSAVAAARGFEKGVGATAVAAAAAAAAVAAAAAAAVAVAHSCLW